jgi:poly-gamma-glutamate synthesis protein (capsule biosynthesis protein)
MRGVRLAFLAFNVVPDPHPASAPGSWQPAQWDQARAVAALSEARQHAHAVIVFLHWGQEYALRAAPWQREAAQALVEAGADLVLGHHPHVVQEWALLPIGQRLPARQPLRNGSALVAFSLGNFLFDQEGAYTEQGLALRVLFDQEGLRAVQALPLWAGLQPRLMTSQEAAPLLARIAPSAARQTFVCDGVGCRDTERAPPQDGQTEGIFWSGSIDLTGDGEPERVRRAAQRVHIYEGAEEVWVSPPQWQVVDVALGDPNDDGRGELLLALWQEDAQGHARSQPFIVGHRGGQYKVLWGGRPVTAPILEVALGDVDGDGTQELLVLEEGRQEAPGQEGRQEAPGQEGRQQAPGEGAGASLAALSVWRWQGWNFSLFWRSVPGAYSDLRLAPTVDGARPVTVAVR